MADTRTGQGAIDTIRVILDHYWADGSTERGKLADTLDDLSVVAYSSIEAAIADGVTNTYTPAGVFGSAGNFKFVAVILLDSTTSTAMQIEINDSGHLHDVADHYISMGSASISQVEIKNNDGGGDPLAVLCVFGR